MAKISEYLRDRLKYEEDLYNNEFAGKPAAVTPKPTAQTYVSTEKKAEVIPSIIPTTTPKAMSPVATTPTPSATDAAASNRADLDAVFEQMMNYEAKPFEYDKDADPIYQKYMESYSKNAKNAAEDTYARAVAGSGGFGNSFAAVASQQAYSEQMDDADDIIPELYEYAYSRHRTAESERKSDLYTKYGLLADRQDSLDAEVETQAAAEENAKSRASAAYGTAYGLAEEGYSAQPIRAALMANGYSEAEATAAVSRLTSTADAGTYSEGGEYVPGGTLNEKIQTGLNSILYTEDEDGKLQLTYDGSQKQSQTAKLRQQGYTDAQIEQIFAEAQYVIDQTVYDAVGELERMEADPENIKMTDITEAYTTYKKLHDTGAISEDAWQEFYGALGDGVVATYKHAADNTGNMTDEDLERLGIKKETWEEYAGKPWAQKELIYNAAAEMVSEGVIHQGDMLQVLLPGVRHEMSNAGESDVDQMKATAGVFSMLMDYYDSGALGDEQLRLLTNRIADSLPEGWYERWTAEYYSSSDGLMAPRYIHEFLWNDEIKTQLANFTKKVSEGKE